MPRGETYRSIGARLAWETRRARYGRTGVSPERVPVMQEKLRRRKHWNRQKTHCKRGHALQGANVIWTRRGERLTRHCRACNQTRQGRPSWVTVAGVRVSVTTHDAFVRRTFKQLRAQLIAAHPDKGGTSRRFIAARAAFETCMAHERHWYAEHGVAPPAWMR